MLLEDPIALTILRLALPNATVMIVQILIGLLEVYFVSRTGMDGLAGVAPVFPLVSLVLAIAQGAIGGGFVTASHAPLAPVGSTLQANTHGTP
jgi:Na+-driven multidrug efflux pump